MVGRIKVAGIVIAVLTGIAVQIRGDVIRLKPTAAVQQHQDVRLGDIASITGDDSARVEALADTVIIAGAEKTSRVKVDDVLMAVISQGGPTAAGASLQIGGAAECEIVVGGKSPARTTRSPGAGTGDAMATVQVGMTTSSKNAAPTVTKASPAGDSNQLTTAEPGTLAEIIQAQVQKELGVPMDDITIRFETISPLVDHPVAAGRKWLCRPLTRTFLGSVGFEAQLVEGTKVIERLNVQTTVQKMQMVPVLLTRMTRGDIITAESVQMQRLPMDRRMTTLFGSERDVIGLEAQKDLETGTMLDTRDFRPAYMAHKNELITVIYLAGSLSVQMRGRAMADAKVHEQVRIRNESTHEEYAATVIGKDLAVAGGTLTPDQEKKLREGTQ